MALLGYGLPRQELSASRLIFERHAADGSAVVRGEWAMLEAFRRPVETRALGPDSGTLAPRFDELEDLRTARLDRSVESGRPVLGRIAAAPSQPAMLYASVVEIPNLSKEPAAILNVAGTKLSVQADALKGVNLRRGIWVRADGSARIIQEKSASAEYGDRAEFSVRSIELLLGETTEPALAKARATALKWAVDSAAREQGEAVIFWSDGRRDGGALISVEGWGGIVGMIFFVRTVGVR